MAKPLVPLNPPPIPDPAKSNQGWGLRIETMFVRIFANSLGGWLNIFSGIISWGIRNVLEDFESEAIPIIKPLLDPIANNDALPIEYRNALKEATSGNHPAALLLLAGALIGLFSGGLSQMLQPLWEVPKQSLNKIIKPAIFDPSTAAKIWFREDGLKTQMLDMFVRSGLNENLHVPYIDSNRPRLPVTELIRLYFRFPDKANNYLSELARQGWAGNDLSNAVDSLTNFLTAQDIIGIADRHALDSDLVSKFSLNGDLSQATVDAAKQAGWDEQSFRALWASHWEPPSINQVIEMWRRLRPGKGGPTFSDSDLAQYFKFVPISPYWHDLYKAVSNELITRVDARRMFEVGTWSEDKLRSHYQDLGYTLQDATDMVNWQKQDQEPSNKTVTQAAILRAYKNKQINRATATSMMDDIGFGQDVADFYLNSVDYDNSQDLLDEQLSVIKAQYVDGQLDDNGTVSAIGKLNLTAEHQSNLLKLWKIARDKTIAYSTATELDDFYQNGIITQGDYRNELVKKNYPANRVVWTLQRADQKRQAFILKTQNDLLVEQARLAKDANASEYNKARNDIDVQIATLNLNIADIKVAAYFNPDGFVVDSAAGDILKIQDQIKGLELQKSQLKVTFTNNKGGL